MFSLFKNSIIKSTLNEADESYMNIDFTKIITDKSQYKNFNLDDSFSKGSIFLSSSNLNEKILTDNTIINNIYSKVYGSGGPTYQGNYPTYNNKDTIYTSSDTDKNWGCFTIPILSTDGSFDSYRVILVFNPWFILSDDSCVTQKLPQITPGNALGSGCSSGVFQKWLFNAGQLTGCISPFTISDNPQVNLKLAFSAENEKLDLYTPDMFSVMDSKNNHYCIAAFQSISSSKSLYGAFVLDAQYSNKKYINDSAINSCSITDTLDSYPDLIYSGKIAPTTTCISFLNTNSTCPYTTIDTNMIFNVTLPTFDGITSSQDCFNFRKPNSDPFKNYFRRGIYDTQSKNCSFKSWNSAGNEPYYTLDQYLQSGNINIPDMLSKPESGTVIYADNGTVTTLSKNNTLIINHNTQQGVDWKNLNTMSNTSVQTIGNIDTRAIRVGCNPDGKNGCIPDTPSGPTQKYLNNDYLYAKGNDNNYYSLSSVEQNIQNAWQLGSTLINGLKINDTKTTNFGNSPFEQPGTGTGLYSLIDTSQVSGMFNNNGTINNNTMFITDTTQFPSNYSEQDWTTNKDGSYQKVNTGTRITDSKSDPYYFNVSEKWGNPNNVPFQAESKFSNYYNPVPGINYCAQVDTLADSPIYDSGSLFATSSLIEYGNTSFITNETLWRCSCPSTDSYSGSDGKSGYCIPPKKYWWYKTETLDTTSNKDYFDQANSFYYNEMNDSVSSNYNRIIYLNGPSDTAPDPSWKQVMKNGSSVESSSLYEVVNYLSTPSNGNMPSDNPNYGDKGIICPSPNFGTTINRGSSFSNQLTSKTGSTDQNNILTYDTLNKYGPQTPTGGQAEVGSISLDKTSEIKFLIGTGANNYNSPGNSTIQSDNTYSCSNNIINPGSLLTSSFPGGFYYEDFYDNSCPASGEWCGTGPYDINNSNKGGKAFPYWNQQSIPVGMQQIYVVIYDKGANAFYSPDSIDYKNTFGKDISIKPEGTSFPILTDIPGFISEPTNICDPKNYPQGLGSGNNVPGWATGNMGSNDNYDSNIGYIPNCFLVGSPLAEMALNKDSRGYIPTDSNDNTYAFNATEGIITITSKYLGQAPVKIKNDLSILRSDTDSTHANQIGSCFITGQSKVPISPFVTNLLTDPSINLQNGSQAPQGWNTKRMQGVKYPCYNTKYNDGVIRINLSNFANASGTKMYLVISSDQDMNINDGKYTLISQ